MFFLWDSEEGTKIADRTVGAFHILRPWPVPLPAYHSPNRRDLASAINRMLPMVLAFGSLVAEVVGIYLVIAHCHAYSNESCHTGVFVLLVKGGQMHS